jgi:putative chitinase
MCISGSVGLNAANNPVDVKLLQILLNENLNRLAPLAALVPDGHMGPTTIQAIAAFQKQVLSIPVPSSRVESPSATLSALRAGMTACLTAGKLQGIMLPADLPLIARYFQPLVTMMTNSQINTPLRIAHFLAQVGHESGDLRYCEELADGSDYEDRVDLGNTHPGDGPRFKGRGLIQLTGRSNYVAFGLARNRDFVTPANYLLLATDPNLAVDASCWYWATHNLNVSADADNLRAITLRINGGYNGLADRAAHLQRAKFFLLP